MKIATSMIEDRIEIINPAGEVVLDLPVRLNVTQVCSQIMQRRIELQSALESGEDEQVGEAIVRLYEICLGEDNANKLFEWYENDYITMINDMTPFFTDILFPAVDAARDRLVESRKKVKVS